MDFSDRRMTMGGSGSPKSSSPSPTSFSPTLQGQKKLPPISEIRRHTHTRRESGGFMHRRRPTDFAKALDIAQTSGMQDDEPFSGGRPSSEPQPLSLWEKLAIASQEAESRRASLDAATDTVGIDDLSDESIAFGYQQSSDDQSPEPPTDSPTDAKPKRFRVLARMVKNNLAWARDLRDKHDEDITRFVVKNSAEGDELVFDLQNFRYQQRAYGGITPRTRRILLKHPIERTAPELQLLRGVVERLKCFQKYPRKVKHELARVLYYEAFDDGRVIIQQGHLGVSFYFIVSGRVQVKYTEINKKTGLSQSQILGELQEGSSFGELALLHNIKRTATIVSKGQNCEFLRIDKADFESVLRQSYEHEWSERLTILRTLPFFANLPQLALESCNNTCLLKEYLSGAVIYGPESFKSDDYVYFVLTGECSVIREIHLLIQNLPFGGQKIIYPNKEQRQKIFKRRDLLDRRISMRFRLERRFWQVCTLKNFSYFGTGEDMTDTYILANDRVECMLVPRLQFVKHGGPKVIEKMREDLSSSLPSTEQAFRQYMEDLRWTKYKRRIISDVITQRPRAARLAALPRLSESIKQYVVAADEEVGEESSSTSTVVN